jgi:AraC-like DNA-binding protein
MTTSDRILKNLIFPAQYLDVGEAITRALNLDITDYYRYCEVRFPRQNTPWETINGKQLQRSNEWMFHICPKDAPPLVTFMAHFPITSHGAIGMLALTSPTLGAALQCAIDYSSLVMPAYTIQRHDLRHDVHLVFERRYDFGEVNRFFTETVVVAFLQIRPFLTKLPTRRPEIHLTHASLGQASDYEKAFAATFIFNSSQNKVVLGKEDLNIALIAPSPTSHLMLKSTLEQQFRLQLEHRPVMQEVKQQLQQALRENNILNAETLANRMSISVRTLSRRLQLEGYTLPQLQVAAGMEYAKLLLLETNKNIAQIASAVGFKNAAAFTRAFKRYTGKTPTTLRAGSNNNNVLIP